MIPLGGLEQDYVVPAMRECFEGGNPSGLFGIPDFGYHSYASGSLSAEQGSRSTHTNCQSMKPTHSIRVSFTAGSRIFWPMESVVGARAVIGPTNAFGIMEIYITGQSSAWTLVYVLCLAI